eukprot:TRINITY_DN18183_c0_g1_i1.p1 TRINITY_DN18183_c0_g1~~TRINITY_DN18183_c0_g1_i1.p1  ORF type:complete len:618 (+),score=142.50 TRINITY_DN18183_c0_g1_i1:202-1854(+)
MSGLHMAYLYVSGVLFASIPILVTIPIEIPIIRIPSHVDHYLIPIGIPDGIDYRLIVIRITTLTLVVIRVEVTIIYEECVKVKLTPPSVGEYLLHIEYNGKALPGTPLKFEVVLSPVVVPIGSEQSVNVGEPASVPFKVENVAPDQLVATIQDPKGEVLKSQLNIISSERVELTFTTLSEGVHDVTWTVKGVVIALTPLEVGISKSITRTTITTTTTTQEVTITEEAPSVSTETSVTVEHIKALGDKCTTLLNMLQSFKPTAAVSFEEFRKEFVSRSELIISMENTDWNVWLIKSDAELFVFIQKLVEENTLLLALLLKNLVLITTEHTRTQIITLLQQNIPKILPAFIQVTVSIADVPSNRRSVAAANYQRIYSAFAQIWTNALQLFKTFKVRSTTTSSANASLTGIDTSADTNTILNNFVSFLNSEKATSATPSMLCAGLSSTPTQYSEAVALWPHVVRALVTEIKKSEEETNMGELLFQSARAVLFLRKVVLEPHGASVKEWDKAVPLLNQFSQELVHLLVAKLTDQDITPKLTTLVGTVKQIQQAL